MGVVYLGWVGRPFAVEKAMVGTRVTGIDENLVRPRMRTGAIHRDVDAKEFEYMVASGDIEVYTRFVGHGSRHGEVKLQLQLDPGNHQKRSQ